MPCCRRIFGIEKVTLMKRILRTEVGLSLILAVTALPALAQNQQSSNSQTAGDGGSLGAYARQIKKESSTGAKPKVFDNDNLPKQDKLSIVGAAPPSDQNGDQAKQDDAAAASSETKDASGANTSEQKPATGNAEQDEAAKQAAWKQWGERIKAQKDQIDLLTRELNVLQREYQIRAAAMYADVGNRLRNSTDWDKQDAQYKQQIADKEKAVDDAKQKLDDLEEEARKAGVPSSIREP
jgi:chromosome segregation ATPase